MNNDKEMIDTMSVSHDFQAMIYSHLSLEVVFFLVYNISVEFQVDYAINCESLRENPGKTSEKRRLTLIDFHTHILPGIDDGSQDISMTEIMLREEMRQGVNLVAATPHFYADQISIDGFLDRRAQAQAQTERLIQEADTPLPAVIDGAEVYYFPGMGHAQEISRLCIGETNTILVELPFEQWDSDVLRDVEALITRQKLNVVLAHVERYIGFQKDKSVWNRMLALPLTPQINAGSFRKSSGLFHSDKKRKFCLDFLQAFPRTIVGSDCHNLENRPPNLAFAMEEIGNALCAESLQSIDAAVRKVLGRVE